MGPVQSMPFVPGPHSTPTARAVIHEPQGLDGAHIEKAATTAAHTVAAQRTGPSHRAGHVRAPNGFDWPASAVLLDAPIRIGVLEEGPARLAVHEFEGTGFAVRHGGIPPLLQARVRYVDVVALHLDVDEARGIEFAVERRRVEDGPRRARHSREQSGVEVVLPGPSSIQATELGDGDGAAGFEHPADLPKNSFPLRQEVRAGHRDELE